MGLLRPTRRARRWRWFTALALAPLLVLAACGGDDDDAAAPEETASVDPNGVLKLGADLVSTGDWKFDPTLANAPGQVWNELVYGTLLRRTADGEYHPALASKATVVDSSTLTIDLRPNQKFSDGTPLTATEVKFSIDRNVAINSGRMFRNAELSQVASVTVDSPTKLTIKLKTPVAGAFYDLLAHEETMPYLPSAATAGTLNTKPVGAGPYTLESYTSGTQFVLAKSPTYIDAAKIRVAKIQVNHVTAQSLVNAVNSHSIDYAEIGSLDTAAQIAPSGLKVNTIENLDSMGFLWITCAATVNKALSDVRVRQALNFATDKEALNQVQLGGGGTVMSQLWPKGTDYNDPKLEGIYKYDPEKAKKLLAEAGFPTLALTFANPGGSVGTTGEILQQQWAKVGITLTIVPTTNLVQDFYVDRKITLYGSPGGVKRFWTDKITRNWAPGSVGNTCDPAPANPTFPTLVTELRGLAHEDPKAIQLWKDIAKIIVEGAYGVFMTHGPTITVVDTAKIGNVQYWPTQVGNYNLDLHEIFIKKQ